MIMKRQNDIDLVKAITIILVVIGHCIQYTNLEFDNNLAFRFIYSFHMPLFMFISGYLSWKKNLSTNFLVKRIRVLVIPFFIWLIIYAIYRNYSDIFNGEFSSFFSYLKNVIIKPDNGGLWFLWVLFIINVIYFFCNKSKYKYLLMSLIIIVLYILSFINVPLLFGFSLVQWHLFFFGLGLAFNEFSILKKIRWIWFFLIVPITLLLEICWRRTDSYSFGIQLSYKVQMLYNLTIDYLVAICMIIVILKLATFYNKRNNIIKWFSENTLAIYAVHSIVMSIILNLTKNFSGDYFTAFIITFILTLIITTMLIIFLKRSSTCDKLLFGKIK